MLHMLRFLCVKSFFGVRSYLVVLSLSLSVAPLCDAM